MGCDATMIAIGPFSKRIVHALNYLEEQYVGVAEGATVICVVFETFGSSNSEDLARCFGMGRWDLGRHHLDATRADLKALGKVDEESAESFVTLRDAGFQFYYMPKG
jgi:hypothetical protein